METEIDHSGRENLGRGNNQYSNKRQLNEEIRKLKIFKITGILPKQCMTSQESSATGRGKNYTVKLNE